MFGKRLRVAMIFSGIKTSDLARHCKVSRQTALKWQKMETADLSGEHLCRVAEVTRVRMRWLVAGDGDVIPARWASRKQ